MIKKNAHLKHSRLLKYHYYSKQTKYHYLCEHRDNACQLNFMFDDISKIHIGDTVYLLARPDQILKQKDCYVISHHLNQT
jgi:hypothetical protein